MFLLASVSLLSLPYVLPRTQHTPTSDCLVHCRGPPRSFFSQSMNNITHTHGELVYSLTKRCSLLWFDVFFLRTSRPLSSTASGLSRRRTLSLSNAQTEARYGHPQHCRRRNPGESSSRSSTSGTSSNPITKPEKWATISDKDGTGIMVESAAELFGGSISLGDGVGVTSAVRVAPPTRAQLKTLFIQSAVPMVGFGECFLFR